MRATKLASAVGTSALLLCALAAASGAQERARQGAPSIRVYSSNGAYTLATTSYVTPVIQVSENAYVFAVSMDLDGQIQVLHPDFPGISVRLLAHKPLNLHNFFAGFGQRDDGSGYYSTAGYSRYGNYGDGSLDSRGTVIALASRAPFNLERIESDGDWNISAIRRLIEGRSPQSAAQALASYLGAKDEPIGRDFMRFAGGQNYNSAYAYGAYSSCDLYFSYGPTLAARFFQASNTIALLRQRGQRATIGYDFCGLPYVIVRSSGLAGGLPGVRPVPRPQGDTTAFPKSRFPHGTPRHPGESASKATPEGIFPLPQHSSLPQMGDVTITAPRGRRSEPGQILQGYRPQPGTMSAPQGRVPIERVSTPRTEPAATGSQPVREYRPEPRSAPPPPARVPDAPRQSPPPPPVVHQAPSSPPPPPPRAETPARVPPPAKQ